MSDMYPPAAMRVVLVAALASVAVQVNASEVVAAVAKQSVASKNILNVRGPISAKRKVKGGPVHCSRGAALEA